MQQLPNNSVLGIREDRISIVSEGAALLSGSICKFVACQWCVPLPSYPAKAASWAEQQPLLPLSSPGTYPSGNPTLWRRAPQTTTKKKRQDKRESIARRVLSPWWSRPSSTMASESSETKSYSTDPALYIYTSLTAGSSHIVTATSRLETILRANRIPFKAIDLATDEKARMLWGRRAGKDATGRQRKLPGLVQMGMVLGVSSFLSAVSPPTFSPLFGSARQVNRLADNLPLKGPR